MFRAVQATSQKAAVNKTTLVAAYAQRFKMCSNFHNVPVRGFAYHQRVLDHYENPRNVGSLDKKDPSVGTGLVGAPACGDVMKLQIKVREEDGTIEKAVFKTFGCGSAIASSSYATEILEGMAIEEAVKIKNSDIAQHLKLPPVKLHCSMLAEDAIQAAIKDYKNKKAAADSQ